MGKGANWKRAHQRILYTPSLASRLKQAVSLSQRQFGRYTTPDRDDNKPDANALLFNFFFVAGTHSAGPWSSSSAQVIYNTYNTYNTYHRLHITSPYTMMTWLRRLRYVVCVPIASGQLNKAGSCGGGTTVPTSTFHYKAKLTANPIIGSTPELVKFQ